MIIWEKKKKDLRRYFSVDHLPSTYKTLGLNPNTTKKKKIRPKYQWLTPVILAAWEAEIRKMSV
jgi:hypothetical protein